MPGEEGCQHGRRWTNFWEVSQEVAGETGQGADTGSAWCHECAARAGGTVLIPKPGAAAPLGRRGSNSCDIIGRKGTVVQS